MSLEREARNRGTRSLAAKIALAGGRIGYSSFLADWSPYCDMPVTLNRRVTSRDTTAPIKVGNSRIRDTVSAMEVSCQVPCRKCAKCLQFRQMRWRERAVNEIIAANRTWFVTLTFSPIHLAGILIEAKVNSKTVELSAYRHVQLYFKRLRKSKCVFRYLAVYERGEETGRSHYHLLLHEKGTRPILKEQLERQWRSFTNCRLVSGDDASGRASYITKYATKSIDIRPRASARYGNTHSPQII